MWHNDCFRLDCATEMRKRSNETWLKIDCWQHHIRIKSMWLRRVYFVLLKFLRARILVTGATGCVPQKGLLLLFASGKLFPVASLCNEKRSHQARTAPIHRPSRAKTL